MINEKIEASAKNKEIFLEFINNRRDKPLTKESIDELIKKMTCFKSLNI